MRRHNPSGKDTNKKGSPLTRSRPVTARRALARRPALCFRRARPAS